jgi:hypothetical protein
MLYSVTMQRWDIVTFAVKFLFLETLLVQPVLNTFLFFYFITVWGCSHFFGFASEYFDL